MSDVDNLLDKVQERLGKFGELHVSLYWYRANRTRQWYLTWFRDYGDEGKSDMRTAGGPDLADALREILAWEDRADEEDSIEASR